MARLAPLSPDALSKAQADVMAETVQGPRGKVPAPVIAWLRSPAVAMHAQRLGATLRFGGVLDPRLRELAILVCARHWTSHHEWTAHKRIALQEGLDPDVIAAVARGEEPPADGSDLALVWRLSASMLRDGGLAPRAYAEALESLGEQGLVELVATLGYYCMVALTLNVFELGLPEGHAPELCAEGTGDGPEG